MFQPRFQQACGLVADVVDLDRLRMRLTEQLDSADQVTTLVAGNRSGNTRLGHVRLQLPMNYLLVRSRDDLHQWKKYAACGQGFAIGLAPHLFGIEPDRPDRKPYEIAFVSPVSYGDAAGHSCFAIAGVTPRGKVEASMTLETGKGDRFENMFLFANAALEFLLKQLAG